MDEETYLIAGDERINISESEMQVKRTLNEPATLVIKINPNLVNLFNYRSKVKVVIRKNDVDQTIFQGFLVSSNIENGVLIIHGADPLQMLKNETINAHYENFAVPDILYTLISMTDLTPSISGTIFDGKTYTFKIVKPVRNLDLDNLTLNYQGISVSKNPPRGLIEILDKSEFKEEFLSEAISFAEIEIEAKDFITAHMSATQRIRGFLDWLSYEKNFSWSKISDTPLEWDYKLALPQPKLSSWFYSELQSVG
ncbi:MAG: hypothetical protein KAR20_23695, partial [Candidatus Heimdallarchaeota archaeon]|nr:hypothetical protein [Candidatus Heimdallarchaeota archaeon]